MANVQQDELFERFIPDVLFEKITLENSGFYPPEVNPHIDDDREEINRTQQVDSLNITLNLVIKEKFSDDAIGQWISNIDLKKYLNIKIFQSTDKDISRLLRVSKDMIALVDPQLKNGVKNSVKQIAKKFLKISNDRLLDARMSKHVSHKKINLTEVVSSNNVYDNMNIKKEVNDDGTESYNIFYTLKFQIRSSQPEHLSYFSLVTFDIEELSRKYELRYPLSDSLSTSRVNTEVIIDNSEPVSVSYSYILSNGKIWMGEVHQVESGAWRTGSSETPSSRDLTRISVSNSKIQDFRNVKEIKKLQFDFKKINSFFDKLDVANISNMPKIRDTRNLFSEIRISPDIDRNATFSFDLNFKDLVISNSRFANLVTSYDSIIANELVALAKIKYLKIFRRRVKESFSQANSATEQGGYVKFHKDEKEDTVAVMAQNSSARFLRTIDNDTSYVGESRTTSFPDLRSIECTDRTTQFLTDGLYQYGIEIEVSDPSIDYLKGKLKILQNTKSKLEKYYAESSRLSITKFYEEVADPHIDSPKEQNRVLGNLEGSYDTLTNSFTDKFKKQMSRRYLDTRTSPWAIGASVYPDLLSIFIGDIDKVFIATEMLKIMSPYTGNPSGILAAISLYDSLISAISSLLGVSDSTDFLGQASSVGKTLKTFKIKHYFSNDVFDSDYDNVVGVQYFDESLIPQVQRRARPNALRRRGVTNSAKSGLLKITGEELQQRSEQETLKYFNSKTPEISVGLPAFNKDSVENSSFSYFTPNVLSTYTKTYNTVQPRDQRNRDITSENSCDTTEANKTDVALNNFRNILIANKNVEGRPIVATNYENLENNLKNLLGSVGKNSSVSIKIVSIKQPESEEESVPSPMMMLYNDTPRTIAAEEAVDKTTSDAGGFSIFLNAIAHDIDYSRPPETTRSPTRNLYSNELIKENNTDRRISVGTIRRNIETNIAEDERQNIPNQLKAAVLVGNGNNSVNPNIISNEKSSRFEIETRQQFNFNTIAEMQYLAGYETGEKGNLLLNSPIWKKMDKNNYSNMPNDRDVLVRFVDYEQPTACGKKPDSIKQLKKLNDKFILRPSTNIKTQETNTLYNIKADNTEISISKDVLDAVSKVVTEQATIPQKNMKSATVDQKSIETIATGIPVRTAVQNKERNKPVTTNLNNKAISRK